MKPAILVALLFRTLDAFRIFDTIYIFNQGAQGTESISMLNYSTLLDRLNLGLGSAVSVLLFLLVALIAFVFIKGFGAGAAPGGGPRDERRRGHAGAVGASAKARARTGCVSEHAGDTSDGRRALLVLVFSLVPVLWIVLLSLKTPATATDGSFIPHHWTLSNYSDIFKTGIFTDALRNSIGIALISTVAGGDARLVGRVRDRAPRLPRQAA